MMLEADAVRSYITGAFQEMKIDTSGIKAPYDANKTNFLPRAKAQAKSAIESIFDRVCEPPEYVMQWLQIRP